MTKSGNFLDLYWMLGDHQGSVTSVLSHNSGQTSVVQQLAYSAFGAIGSIKDGQGNNVTTGPISRFAYTGREFDPETGDYHYRARYYDPQSGRFLSQDPIGFAAGDMNLYRYVGNSSPNWVDPSGTFVMFAPAIPWIVGGAVAVGEELLVLGGSILVAGLVWYTGQEVVEACEIILQSQGGELKEVYDDPSDAVGDPTGNSKIIGQEPTNNPGLIDQGSTKTVYVRDPCGRQWTVHHNPKTGKYGGAHLCGSSR